MTPVIGSDPLSQIRIFLSSPGDASDERAVAMQVIERLNLDPSLRDRVNLRPITWIRSHAKTPMLAHLTPQESVNLNLPRPSECHIVVVVLWSRMGTPMKAYRKADGKGYLSGTEWEFWDAYISAKEQGRPQVLLYRRTEVCLLNRKAPDFKEKIRQQELVDEFFDGFRESDGSLLAGFCEYAAVTDFQLQLESDLREFIWPLVENLPIARSADTDTSEPAARPSLSGSPFPGLRPFTDGDAAIFFGRERETEDLIRKLSHSECRFLAVVGASGSGKSSLVWAGLIPRLLGGSIPGSQDWRWLRLTPGEVGDDPFLALANAFKPTLDKQGQRLSDAAKQIRHSPDAFEALVAAHLETAPDWAELLLFIDQFEELFTLVAENHLDAFVDWVDGATRMDRVRIVATMRADFYHRAVEHPKLAERLRRATYTLAAPGCGALTEMISRPAATAGLTFDPELPQRIVDEAGAEPGGLALVAFALAELYAARTSAGRLTTTAYDASGGLRGAIGKRADQAFKSLPTEARQSLHDVFRGLVEVNERGVPTRRRSLLSEVLEKTADPEAAATLVEALTGARLLVTDRQNVVEVAHEALFTHWPRLSEWIEERRDDLYLERQVRLQSDQWEANQRRERYLWPDERVMEEVAPMLGRLKLNERILSPVTNAFLGTPLGREAMEAELADEETSHQRRAQIGVRLSLIGDTRQGVGLREDGLPEIEWCQVPAGRVELEDGRGEFEIEPFQIAKYPVTWVQWRAFIEAKDGFENPEWWDGLWFQVAEPGRQFNRHDNHPAENLTWLEAVAFSRWLSARLESDVRLPTEWQWQQAATAGDPGRDYPWGAWKENRANTHESELHKTTAVGLYLHGASSVQALDMCGNVWEWCLNEYAKPLAGEPGDETIHLGGEGRRVVRGGSYDDGRRAARAAFRLRGDPNLRGFNVGVRLACLAPIL